jgi:predicted ATP-dependent serine protease
MEGLVEVDVGIDAPPIDWIVTGMVARGAVTMIAGEAGAGKSTFTQAVVGAVTRGGGSVAGWPVVGGRATIIDAENGAPVIAGRLHASRAVEGNVVVHAAFGGFDIEEDIEEVRRVAQGSDLLVLDSWASLWSGNENNVKAVKTCLNGLREVARDVGCGVLLIHHTTKDGKNYRGSSAVAATIEAVFTLTREDDEGGRLITCRKMRLDKEPPPQPLQLVGGTVGGVARRQPAHDYRGYNPSHARVSGMHVAAQVAAVVVWLVVLVMVLAG